MLRLRFNDKSGDAPKEDAQLKELEKDCYQELYSFIKSCALASGYSTWSLMGNTSIRMMSFQMPQTREEMLQIVGVTEANLKKCNGDALLEITQRYRTEKEGKENWLLLIFCCYWICLKRVFVY